MQKSQVFTGIDISKLTLDMCLLKGKENTHYQIDNDIESIETFLNEHLSQQDEHYICLENTGKYGWLLIEVLANFPFKFYVVNPLHLHKSLGLTRGKTDKIGAQRIATFIKKNYEELSQHQYCEKLQTLQVLITERAFKVKKQRQLNTKEKEFSLLSNKKLAQKLIQQNQEIKEVLQTQIKELENEIEQTITEDVSLKEIYEIICSVPGVGKVLAWNLIVITGAFTKINQVRRLACYAGVAPFVKQSGLRF